MSGIYDKMVKRNTDEEPVEEDALVAEPVAVPVPKTKAPRTPRPKGKAKK